MYQFIYLSIDPGTNMLGTAINAINEKGEWEILNVHTTNIGAIIQHLYRAGDVERIGLRYYRAQAVAKVISNISLAWGVHHAVSESPYMGKFATSFAALTECMMAITNGCAQYDINMSLTRIDPSTIKKSVGVPGNSGNKELMRVAVDALVPASVMVGFLDEHSIDAIAVGYAYYKTHLEPYYRRGD